ncbi:MAG: helix-turn-helix transcriptional regulator [Hyphomicrobiales bacterium]|nr:helix-turn-helix transcriptional regulator [Hyphomicrobiales bacterium]
MLSHRQIWAAIDRLAENSDLSTSGLARRAGLDPTTFNRSKRIAADGRQRWPSTESVAKILEATGTTLHDFIDLTGARRPRGRVSAARRRVPLIGLAQAGAGGFFDDSGFPAGQGWDQIDYPGRADESVYALEVAGDSMLPLYRSGDIIVVSPSATCRRADRVVVKTHNGEVMAKILQRRTSKLVELASLNPDHPVRRLALADVEWMARIIWASQ